MTQKLYVVLLAIAVIFLGVIAFTPATTVQQAAQKFGATSINQITNWVGGSFSGDLSVGGNLTLSETALSDNSGAVVPQKSAVITMTSGTTTPCAIKNNSGVTRTLTTIGVTERGTAASLGAIRFTAGTGTTAFKTSFYTKFLGAAITKVNGADVISTTSTLMSAYGPWRTGENIVFYSATTVHSGTCRVAWY